MIHWQLSGADISSVFSGGFDFNTETQAITNITVKSMATEPYCVACHDFTNSGTGMPLPYNTGIGVQFVDELWAGSELERRYTLKAVGGNNLTFNVPGTYTDLFIEYIGWINLHNPYDPDIFNDLNCNCGTAVGTIVPVPEPRTYALLLAGIGMIGDG